MYELVRKKRGKRSGTALSGTYADEVTAFLYAIKRMQLDQRDSMSMMREDEAQGDRPASATDLNRGIVILQRVLPRITTSCRKWGHSSPENGFYLPLDPTAG